MTSSWEWWVSLHEAISPGSSGPCSSLEPDHVQLRPGVGVSGQDLPSNLVGTRGRSPRPLPHWIMW